MAAGTIPRRDERTQRSQRHQAAKAADTTASAALTAALFRSAASGPSTAALKAETATETAMQGMAAKRYRKPTAPPMALGWRPL
jgi:hypothetical protein